MLLFDDVIIPEQISSDTNIGPRIAQQEHVFPSSNFCHKILYISHRGPVNSLQKWPVTRKMFPFDDVITRYMLQHIIFRHHGDSWQIILSKYLKKQAA